MQFEHISEHPSTSLRNGLHSTKKDKELLHIIENIIDSQKKMLSPIQKKGITKIKFYNLTKLNFLNFFSF